MKLKKYSVILAVLLLAILAIGAVSAESIDDTDVSTDSIDDVSVDITDNDVKNSLGAVALGDGEETSYDIDDDSYSTYFNENGTATDKLDPMGNYTLNIGNITNKDLKIESGSSINIIAKDNGGFINNGTLTIGDGAGSAGSIFISGLTFTNIDKDGIVVNDLSTDITIDDNTFDLTYTSTYAGSPMAIVTYGYVDDVEITDNEITMVSSAGYTYGIDLSYYLAGWTSYASSNAEHFYIADNIINITAGGMAEAMYLDTIANSVIENNIIEVTTSAAGTANYAMQIADSWGFFNDPYAASPYNITINNNAIDLNSADMAYGITVISLWPYDEDYETMVKDIQILENAIIIESQTGAIGIGVKTSDVLVDGNTIIISANETAPVSCYPDPAFGNESAAIYVANFDSMMGYYINNTVLYNFINANVRAVKVNSTESEVKPLIIENNTFFINDDTYAVYFNEDGTATDELSADGDYTLLIDEITNKDMIIDSGSNINIIASDECLITNGTLTIGDGAGSAASILIAGLNFVNVDKDGIVVNDLSTDITIDDNTFDLTYTSTYAGSPMAIVTYGFVDDVEITDNEITMVSSAGYTYGIDLSYYLAGWTSYASSNAEHFYIADNIIDITSDAVGGMAEAMYLDTIANSVIENNIIKVTTLAAGTANYAMQVADSWGFYNDPFAASPYNITINNNLVNLYSADMAYGITVISLWPYDEEYETIVKDIQILDNFVVIDSQTGAVGIGVKTSDVLVDGNTIIISANETAPVSCYPDPAFGNESAAIYVVNSDKDMGYYTNDTVTNNFIIGDIDEGVKVNSTGTEVEPLVIENNTVFPLYVINDETYDIYFTNEGTTDILEGGETLYFGNLTNKDVIIDIPLIITAMDEYSGIIYNGTIILNGVSQTVINGLTFINYNKDGIVLNGTVQDIMIVGNKIGVHGDGGADYLYGISLMSWGSQTNPDNIQILSNTIFMYMTDGAMAEAMYLSNPTHLYVIGNNVTVITTSDIFAYGIQVADDVQYVYSDAGYTGNITSPHDILISGNEFRLSSEYMIYGITVLDYGVDGYDEELLLDDEYFPNYFAFELNTTISDNVIFAKSTKGIMGIAGQTYNMTVTDNDLVVIGGDTTGVVSYDALGVGTYALAVEYDAAGSEDDYYVIVKDNTVFTNVDKEYLNSELYEDYVTFENNEDLYINDDTYSLFFTDDGTSKGLLPEEGGYSLIIEELNNKDIIIDSGSYINIYAKDEDSGIINNGTITIGEVDGLIINGLKFDNTDKDAIDLNGAVQGVMITNNNINIVGNGDTDYLYAINLMSWGALTNPDNIVIYYNNITMDMSAGAMAEAIYLDNPTNAFVKYNNVTVITHGDVFAYGIQVSDSAQYVYYEEGYLGNITSPHDIFISENTFNLFSEYMVYGITVLSFGADGYDEEYLDFEFYMPHCYAFELNTEISNNTVNALSTKGLIGIAGQIYNMTVSGNKVKIGAGNATGVVSYDSLGVGTYAIGVQYNAGTSEDDYYVIVNDNEIFTNVGGEYINSEDYLDYVFFDNSPVEIGITYDADKTTVQYRENITYTITVTNTGVCYAHDVAVVNTISDLLTVIDVEGGEYNKTSGVWTIGDLAINKSATLTIVALVSSNGTIINNAVASASKADDVEVNSTAVEATYVIINDETYDIYFDENGAVRHNGAILDGDTILFGDLTAKKFVIEMPLIINAVDNTTKLVNSTIKIISGAEGTVIDGLAMEFTGDNATGSVGIIYVLGVSDVSILNNEILVPDFVDKAGAKYGSSLYAIEVESGAAGANNIIIDGNYINVTGSSRYLYGIDVFKTWGSENANSYITITNNDIWIDPASRMSEGIYASDIANALISGNFIYSESDAAAYGIGTDSLTDSAITDNEIYAVAMTQAYGITSTNSKNVEITDNEIESTGEGAIGIGTNSEFVTIDDNDIVITGGDYTSITSSDTLGTANAAVLDKGTNNTIGDNDVEEDIPVTINDDNYADYFDENGYLKNDSGILDGDIVFFDTLSNKNMKITQCLTIKGAPGNKLVNSTFTLLYEASGSTVANLNIEFTGDNTTGSVGIIYALAASDIEISGNNITVLDFVDKAGAKYGSSVYAIEIESGAAGSSFVLIKDNNIDITGSSRYLYGIDVFKTWGSENGNSQFFITNNFVSVDGASRMSEGIYASDIEEAYIEENTILSSGTTAAYGIGTDSLTNSTILDNVIGVIAGTQAYAITNTFSENVDISENHINASGVGAIGIGTNSEKVTIEDNEIEITGGDYTSITSSDTLGTGNAAIFLKTDDATLNNNTVTENMPIIVDDFTYLRYFNEDGTINEDAIKAGDTVFIGELADKIMTFDVAVEIAPANTSKLTDSLINIVAGADGTYIHGLDIEFTGDAYTGSVGLIYLKSVSNVIVSDNAIVVPDFVNKEGSKYGSSFYAIEVESGVDGCDNILISANYIEINGTANYLYGIDVFKTWGGEKNNTQISINSNDIIINGGAKMAEAIYVSESNDVEVIDNEIYCLAQAAGYGIGTDRLTESLISGNIIEIEAETTAYGITATVSGSDAVIEGNDVTIEGISAVGIGLSGQENATVANNTVDVLGGDYSAVTSSDSLGTAIAAILDKDNSNTNLVVEGNNLTENYLEVNTTHNGNSSKELQALIDAAEAGSVLDLQDVIYAGISNVVIDKDLTIANGTFIGKAGETVFIIPANGPSEVNFTDNIFGINNANTLVLATATNGTSPTAIDTPTINIVNNEFVLKEGAVGESATILELDSERSSLAPSGQLSVVNNTIDAGINPFEFKVTSFENEGNAEVPAGGNIPEKVETVILLENMTTFAYQSSVDGDIGDYFYATLQDVNGNPLANKTVKVGLNGNIYTRTTNETGGIGVLMKTAISGRYTFAVSFLGDDNYNASFAVALCTVNKQTPKLSTSSKTYKASAKTKTLSATFKTKAGHALKGKTIKFTVNGKTYSATTNSNGVASVKVSLSKKGTYSFTAKYAGDSTYASVSKKATLKLT